MSQGLEPPAGGPVPPVVRAAASGSEGLLIVAGIAELVLSAFAALFGLANLATLLFADRLALGRPRPALLGETPLGSYLTLAVVGEYLGAAIFFLAVGIGTLRARRWARALMLVASWLWLAAGGMTTGLMAMMLPGVARGLGADDAMAGAILAVVLALLGFFGVVLPALFVLLYNRRGVREIFERRHPEPDWTDGRPTSVLGLSLAMGLFGAVSLLMLPLGTAQLFGRVFTGAPAVLVIVVNAAAWGLMGWLLYRITPGGWWANVVFAAAMHVVWLTSLRGAALTELFTQTGVDTTSLGGTQEFLDAWSAWLPYVLLASALIWIGSLFYLRKYFRPARLPWPPSAPP
jgi:hypothetical protein